MSDTRKQGKMSSKSSKTVNVSLLGKEFDPESFELVKGRSGAFWNVGGKTPVVQSPVLQVAVPPRSIPWRPREYSIGFSVHLKTKGGELGNQRMNDLVDHATTTATDYVLENSKHMVKTDNLDEANLDVQSVWSTGKDDKSAPRFYANFKPSVPVQYLDREESKKQGKHVYRTVTEDPRKYLGPGSLVTIYFRPSINAYKRKKKKNESDPDYCLRPLDLVAERIFVWHYAKVEDPDADTGGFVSKKHGWLEGFALQPPNGYEGPQPQKAVPVIDSSEWDDSKFTVSKVSDGNRGPMIYARYGNSLGPVYVRSRGVIKYDASRDQKWSTRSLTFCAQPENDQIFNIMRTTWSKVLEKVHEGSAKIWGEANESMEETLELCGSPFYSQNDSDRLNPRVNMKLPLLDTKDEPKTDKPLFDVYILEHPDLESGEENGRLTKLVMEEDCAEMEDYLQPGTAVQVIWCVRPWIVNDKIYNSFRVSQVLVDPNQDRVVAPALSGFAFPGYENAEIPDRTASAVAELDSKTADFTKPKPNKDGRVFFSLKCPDTDGTNSANIVLPGAHKLAFDVGIDDTPDEELGFSTGFRARFNFVDSGDEFMGLMNELQEALYAFCAKKSEDLFGSEKSEKIVRKMTGSLIKHSKKDKEAGDLSRPFWTCKTPVYDDIQGNPSFPFELYRYIPSTDESGNQAGIVMKVDLTEPEDLQKVLYGDAWLRLVVNLKGWAVDGRVRPAMTLAQAILVQDPSIPVNIPFVGGGDDMVKMSTDAYEEFLQKQAEAEEAEEAETEQGGEEFEPPISETVPETVPDTEDADDQESGSPESEDNQEDDGGSDEESEEESEEESD
jgi:hypothetical protein